MQTQPGADWSSFLVSFGIFLFVIFFLYIFFAIMLMMIAKRTQTPGGGLAWLPIANIFLMCKIARRPNWWALMCFVPVLNLLFFAMLWMGIAETSSKSIFVGLLAIIPGIGLLVPIYLALTAKPPITTISAPDCASCNTPIVYGEGFCRQCGQSAPTVVKTTSTHRHTSGGRLFLVASGAAIPVLLLFGIFGWVSMGRILAYSPPERKSPDMPERTAGTLTEFPVDTDTTAPTEPGSMIADDMQNAANVKTDTSAQIPQKRLPSGVTRESLKKRATTATSVAYRPKKTTQATVTTTNSAPEIYVNVLRTAPGQTKVADAIATDIVKATSGSTRTGTKVQSPKGGTYTGSKIATPQISVYVLEKQSSDVVILIYSPTAAGNETAARLAGNIGNGEGINDYPIIKNAVWTLPQRPPNLTLIDFHTQNRDEWGLSDSDLNGVKTNDDTQKIIEYFRQFIPERATSARYRDGQGKIWEVAVYDYETAGKAWNIWMVLKWTVGLNSQPVTIKNSSAIYADTTEGRVLMFQRGMYLILIKAPTAAPIDTMTALGDGVQV